MPQPPCHVVSAEEVTEGYRWADGIFVLIKVSCRVLYGLYSYSLYSYDVYIVMAYIGTAYIAMAHIVMAYYGLYS